MHETPAPTARTNLSALREQLRRNPLIFQSGEDVNIPADPRFRTPDARQYLIDKKIQRDKETAKRINPNIDFAAFEVGHQTLRYACFLCKLALRHALSRRLALSHTETAGGVRSIIVVLLEISMENIPDSVYFYVIPKQVFNSFTLCH